MQQRKKQQPKKPNTEDWKENAWREDSAKCVCALLNWPPKIEIKLSAHSHSTLCLTHTHAHKHTHDVFDWSMMIFICKNGESCIGIIAQMLIICSDYSTVLLFSVVEWASDWLRDVDTNVRFRCDFPKHFWETTESGLLSKFQAMQIRLCWSLQTHQHKRDSMWAKNCMAFCVGIINCCACKSDCMLWCACVRT